MDLSQYVAWLMERVDSHLLSPTALRGHAILAGVLLATIVLEMAARRDWRVRYRSRSFRVDLVYYVLYYGGIYHVLFFAPIYRALTNLTSQYAPGLQLGLLHQMSPVWQTLTLVLVSDFVGYWGHRWTHAIAPLWRFHSIHHSQATLTVMTNYRFHFVDETVRRLVLFIPAQVLGTGTTVWLAADLVMAWILLLQHSEWDWDYGRLGLLFVSPVFHRKHHSLDPELQNRNFGMLFTFWDDAFGTAERIRPAPTAYGLAEERIPESFLKQQLWPFARLLGRPSPVGAPAPPAPPARGLG